MASDHTRRLFLIAGGTLAAAGLSFDAAAQELQPTPACHGADEPVTLRQTEGPFFKPSSPQRSELREPGSAGVTVELTGLVLTRRCKPVAGALVDLWHADHDGEYDNTGFRFRGHQYTDANGVYRFRTVKPARYTGRTRHYHVKVQAPGGRVLTTQLYFPDEPGNRRDSMFRSELLMKVARVADGEAARFDFVLELR